MPKYSFKTLSTKTLITFLTLSTFLTFTGAGCTRTASQEVKDRSKPITLNYWRVFDDSDAFDGLIKAYRQLHPNVQIAYRKLTYDEYEKTVLTALSEDRGPDILSLQNTWMNRWQSRLLPVPTTLSVPFREITGTIKKQEVTVLRDVPGMTPKKVQTDFADVVAKDVILKTPQADPKAPLLDRVYGLPLSVDTMVLYANKELLNNAGIAQPAKYWKDFQDQVKKITRLDETGAIIQSGAAIGTSTNVERQSDILSALMLQNGAVMTDQDGIAVFDKIPAAFASRQTAPGAEALTFYSDFANPEKEVYTWNDRMPASLEAFVRGQTAYFFGYAYHLPLIKARNPNLKFSVNPFPQIEGNTPVAYANYWVESVSKKTKFPNEAWDFIQFITDQKNVDKYLTATRKPPSLRSLMKLQVNDLELAAFGDQLPFAKSWYHGNDAIATENAFADMIKQVLTGEDPNKVIILGATKVNQTLK
jgi:multiple sugar transport system substrate-binding protein